MEALRGALRVNKRPIRLMFQDEARFGRMVRIRKCWAPPSVRPVVFNGYERQFTYVYGAVSPADGHFEWMLSEKMNTVQMGAFLAQVSAAFPEEFIVMVVDGASSHVSKELAVPENVHLFRLPPYSPELNPTENVWDSLREKLFPNRVYASMEEVTSVLLEGLPAFAADKDALKSLTLWPWINDVI